MNGIQITIYALVVISVVLVCRYPRSTAARAGAIFFLCFIALFGFVGLLTCSRLAVELHSTSTHEAPSREWLDGAIATRDSVYRGATPLLVAAFIGIVLVAATPWSSRSSRTQLTNDRNA